MKIKILTIICVWFMICMTPGQANAQSKNLRLVFIRHAEKSDNGDNLNCQGFNRSLLLASLLKKKFGEPSAVFVPALKLGDVTKHMRMLQTISPFAIKYNAAINSKFDVEDYRGISQALLGEHGTIIIVWEHQGIPAILHYLGIRAYLLNWPGDDFDSIWIVTFPNHSAILTRDKEQLNPVGGCLF
jgi:hypothetical protein